MTEHRDATSSLRTVTAIAGELTSEADVIATLVLLRELHDWIAAAQTTAVGHAMAEGHPHRDIGEALGVSQQAISKRYACVKDEEQKDSPEPRQKTASAAKALVHFTLDGNYVGYSLTVEVDDARVAQRPPTQRDSGEPFPDAAHDEPRDSD